MPQQTQIVESTANRLVDVVERILDKGIVIDAWVSVSVIGIELLTIEARVIVASVETYVKNAAVLGYIGPIAGGLREPTKRKTLGEGLEDISKGIQSATQSIPALGDIGQTSQSLTGGILGGRQEREKEPAGQRNKGRKRKTAARRRKK